MCDILLLDDDVALLVILAEALREQGFVVEEVSQAPEALARLRLPASPRVFVTDLDLGDGWDGYVVARAARELVPDIPVVFITGRDTGRPGPAPDGWHCLLRKPFRFVQLRAAIWQVAPLLMAA